jgi:hypothetical protein
LESKDDNDTDVEDNFDLADGAEDEPYHSNMPMKGAESIDAPSTLLHADIDAAEWKVELERVAPKLKSQQYRANSEWRSHIAQVVDNSTSIKNVLVTTKSDITTTTR